jgi:hypothetical protein
MATATATRTWYRIKMDHIEACNCQHGCNCQFGGFPNEGKCEFLIGYHITEGRYGHADLSGTKVVIGMKYPGAIHEGSGTCVLFVDEDASQEQVDAIDEIWSGRAGGMPWEALAGTLASREGPVRRPIRMSVDGKRSSFEIPGILELELTPLIDPVTGDEKDVQIRYPKGGFFWNTADCTTSAAMKIDYGDLKFSYPGKFGSVAVAEWSNGA